ncbi:MAG: substrate-binding domain-containing protein [Firmicutes bacterium]|nr:substrate-binding domain-containing protein [Bacillota bacterium]
MKKKFIAMLVASLMLVGVFAFVGCDKKAEADFVVDVFVYADSDEYGFDLSRTIEGMIKTEYKDISVEVNHHDANWDGATQTRQIDDALTRGTDLLVVALQEYTSAESVAKKAKDNGINVIFFVREPYDNASFNGLTGNDNAIFVGLENEDGGNQQGEQIFEALTSEGSQYKVQDGTEENPTYVNYLMFRGNVGNPAADARSANSVAKANQLLADRNIVLQKYDTDSEVDVAWFDGAVKEWLADKTDYEYASATSGNDGKVNLIIGNSDALTIGAIDTLADKGVNTGDSNQKTSIPMFGFDASKFGKEYIKNGRMTATLIGEYDYFASTVLQVVKNSKDGLIGQALASTGMSDLSTALGKKIDVKAAEHIVNVFYDKYVQA